LQRFSVVGRQPFRHLKFVDVDGQVGQVKRARFRQQSPP
jgi:hypothetical protein